MNATADTHDRESTTIHAGPTVAENLDTVRDIALGGHGTREDAIRLLIWEFAADVEDLAIKPDGSLVAVPDTDPLEATETYARK